MSGTKTMRSPPGNRELTDQVVRLNLRVAFGVYVRAVAEPSARQHSRGSTRLSRERCGSAERDAPERAADPHGYAVAWPAICCFANVRD